MDPTYIRNHWPQVPNWLRLKINTPLLIISNRDAFDKRRFGTNHPDIIKEEYFLGTCEDFIITLADKMESISVDDLYNKCTISHYMKEKNVRIYKKEEFKFFINPYVKYNEIKRREKIYILPSFSLKSYIHHIPATDLIVVCDPCENYVDEKNYETLDSYKNKIISQRLFDQYPNYFKEIFKMK